MPHTHVLISRPQPEAQRLAERFSGAPLQPVVMPVSRFEPMHPGIDLGEAWDGAQRRLAVFTSTRAVEFGLRLLPAGFLEGVEIAAIGPATAESLDRAGYGVTHLPQDEFTSEALLQLAGLRDRPGRALLFAAPGGRRALLEGLQGLGWDAELVFVYRRDTMDPAPQDVEILAGAKGVVSVWTSAQAAEALFAVLPAKVLDRLRSGVAVVPSDRLADRLRAHGVDDVRLASGPGNEALAAAVLELI